jgi:glycosyltransferase involved in cell wall biosynthesis
VAKPAILVLTSTFPRWKNDDAPPFVFELCRRLTLVYDVHVSAPHAPGSLTSETLDGIHVHRFRYFLSSGQKIAYDGGILPKLRKRPHLVALVPFFLFFQLLAAVRIARRYRVKVLHAHWILPQGAIALFTRHFSGGNAGILCTLHGADLYGLQGRIFDVIRRAILRRTDRLTVVSRAMQSDLPLIPDAQKISVVPMGVDLRMRFTPGMVPERGKSLLFIGRLVEKKGLRYLIEAMPSIVEHCPDACLRVVGSGPERPAYEHMARQMGLSDRIQFLGAIPNSDLPALYRSSSVFVFPSVVGKSGDREGFGLVLVEAMGCGCAVAASDLPPVRDIIRPWKTGGVFAPADSAQLGAAVLRLLSDSALRESLARNGRDFAVEHFDWELITLRYMRLLNELVRD